MADAADTRVMTPVCRLAYPFLFDPNPKNERRQFTAVLIFDADADMGQMKAAVVAAAQKKWPGRGLDLLKSKDAASPILNRANYSGKSTFYAGEGWYVNVKSSEQPGIVDAKVVPVLDKRELFGGLLVRCTVNAHAYEQSGNKGVSFYLQNLQIVKDDGTRWGPAAVKPEDDFEPVGSVGEAAVTADELFD